MVFDDSGWWEVVYIISPKDSFKQLVANLDDAKHRLKPVIWPIGSRDQWDWREEDYELLAKLTFMLANYRLRKQHPTLEFNVVDGILLNPDVLTAQTFDQWWNLEKAHVSTGIQMLMKKTTLAETKMIPQTGNSHIDGWIDGFAESILYRTNKEALQEYTPSFLRRKNESQDEQK